MEGKPGRPPSPRIFVSYRRDDASGYAGRIYDALVERFGDDRVFMDVDDIHPGRDFAEVLAEALDRTDVLLVIIGPTWAVRRGLRRHRRLDNRRDYVRIELMAAMERGIGVVPVLLPNARMPSEQQLPQALAPLATIQAIELSDRRWKPDMRALIRLLETQTPGVPIGRNRATAPAARDDVGKPTLQPADRKLTFRQRWVGSVRRRPMRWTLGTVAAVVLLPLVAFLLAWATLDVPPAVQAPAPQVAVFTFSGGEEVAALQLRVNGQYVNRSVVTLDKVPLPLRQAVIAAEDPSFYSNSGVALFAGSPTITQQFVATATGLDDPSIWDEFRLFVLAVKVSHLETKDQILENYMNTIYFGRGAYGVEAGAQAYFGKDPEQLNIAEGALLAAVIQSPSQLDPMENPGASNERWNTVLDGMVAQGSLPYTERVAEAFPHVLPMAPQIDGIPTDDRKHIYAHAIAELKAAGIDEDVIRTGGLTVTLTIDANTQKAAVDAVNKLLKVQPVDLRSALVSVDPRTGAILAYYGGSGGSGPDWADVPHPAGATLTPFVLSTALQSGTGIGLGTVRDGTSPQTIAGRTVTNLGSSCDQCSLRTAMTKSIDTIFDKLAVDIDAQRVVDAARRAGIPLDQQPTGDARIAFGDAQVRVLDIASAYATVAADGSRRPPHLVQKVTARDGRVLYAGPQLAGSNALPGQVARNVTESMLDVAATEGVALAAGRPAAAKSGTAQVDGQNTDAWFVGYTPQIATAVWVGTADGRGPILTRSDAPVYGRTLPGPIWQAFMNTALRGAPREEFSPFVPIGPA